MLVEQRDVWGDLQEQRERVQRGACGGADVVEGALRSAVVGRLVEVDDLQDALEEELIFFLVLRDVTDRAVGDGGDLPPLRHTWCTGLSTGAGAGARSCSETSMWCAASMVCVSSSTWHTTSGRGMCQPPAPGAARKRQTAINTTKTEIVLAGILKKHAWVEHKYVFALFS